MSKKLRSIVEDLDNAMALLRESDAADPHEDRVLEGDDEDEDDEDDEDDDESKTSKKKKKSDEVDEGSDDDEDDDDEDDDDEDEDKKKKSKKKSGDDESQDEAYELFLHLGRRVCMEVFGTDFSRELPTLSDDVSSRKGEVHESVQEYLTNYHTLNKPLYESTEKQVYREDYHLAAALWALSEMTAIDYDALLEAEEDDVLSAFVEEVQDCDSLDEVWGKVASVAMGAVRSAAANPAVRDKAKRLAIKHGPGLVKKAAPAIKRGVQKVGGMLRGALPSPRGGGKPNDPKGIGEALPLLALAGGVARHVAGAAVANKLLKKKEQPTEESARALRRAALFFGK